MAMFLGEFKHTIDDKGRLTVPARFRPVFESGLFVTVGLDQCLWVYSREGWDLFSQKLARLPSGDAQARMATRFFFSQATDAQPDRQGRILLPENLRQYANLGDGAVVIGANERVEIWQPDRWEATKAAFQANLAEIAAQLTSLSI